MVKLKAFDDTTVTAMVILQKAGLFEYASEVYVKAIYYRDRWNVDHIAQLKLANMRNEARDLYGKTKQWAGHVDPLTIIQKLKEVGLDEDAADFKNSAMKRNQLKNKK